MPVSNRHILEQGSALSALGRIMLGSLEQQVLGKRPTKRAAQVPSQKIDVTLLPRSAELIRDYVHNVGGDPSVYRNTVPAHFFPQWGFGVGSRTIEGLPYQLARVLNVGCNYELRTPIPAGDVQREGN